VSAAVAAAPSGTPQSDRAGGAAAADRLDSDTTFSPASAGSHSPCDGGSDDSAPAHTPPQPTLRGPPSVAVVTCSLIVPPPTAATHFNLLKCCFSSE
jgi:hypothetical protein